MPLPSQTKCIVCDDQIYTGPTSDPEKFLIYTWEGRSQQGRGNWKITMPLTVISHAPLDLPLLRKSMSLPPRITLGKPVPPEPPIIMGGGVPVRGLTAGSRIDRKTQKRSDEYKLLRSQALPSQEHHEYTAYPEDVQPGQNTRRKRTTPIRDAKAEVIYHSYLSLSWQYLGLQERVLDCLNNLEPICIAHYLPTEMLNQSVHSDSASPNRKKSMRFSSALRHRMEAFISQGKIALLMGKLRSVAMQLEAITGEALSENEIHELENFQAFEELAALDRGLPVIFLYPFHNIYEMDRTQSRSATEAAGEKNIVGNREHTIEYAKGHNRHSKEISYTPPLRELRCLLEPGPLQQKLDSYAAPSLHL